MKKNTIFLAFLCLVGLVTSCKKEIDIPDSELVEESFELKKISQEELDAIISSINFDDTIKFNELNEEKAYLQEASSLQHEIKTKFLQKHLKSKSN